MRRMLICFLFAAALATAGCEFLNVTGGSGGDHPAETIILLGENDIVESLPADAAAVKEVSLKGVDSSWR